MARWFELDLIEAAGEGKLADVEFLICSLKADVNAAEETRGDTALIAACKGGQVETVKYLLKIEEIDVNKCGKNGKPPLFIVCSKTSSEDIFVTKNLEIVSLLLGHQDIDVNTRDRTSTTALMAALRFQSTVYKLLLQHPDIDVNLQKEDGTTALMVATSNGNMDAVRELLKNYEIDIFLENKRGETAFSIARTKKLTRIYELLYPKSMWKEAQTESRSPFRVLRRSPSASSSCSKSNILVSPVPTGKHIPKLTAHVESESEIASLLSAHDFNAVYAEAFHRNGIFEIEDAVKLSKGQIKDLIGASNYKFSEVDRLLKLFKTNLSLKNCVSKKKIILYGTMPVGSSQDDTTRGRIHNILNNAKTSFGKDAVEWTDVGNGNNLRAMLDKVKHAALYLVIVPTETYFQSKDGKNYIRVGALTWAIKYKVPVVVFLLPKYDHGHVATNARLFFTDVKRHFREYISDSDLSVLKKQGISQIDVVTAFELLAKKKIIPPMKMS